MFLNICFFYLRIKKVIIILLFSNETIASTVALWVKVLQVNRKNPGSNHTKRSAGLKRPNLVMRLPVTFGLK